ncbi:MAG: ABC transporter permease [Deltaproteobacteria bacterium]|nr:ABC transporter permease [Deltaproteobacteria bacterium]
MQNFLILIDFVKKLYRSRYTLKMLAMRDLKAQYVGSFFGFFWALINPLAQVVVYGVIFGVFFKSTPDPVYRTDSFLLFLLCGIVPWQFLSQAVSASSGVLLSNRNLIKKSPGFPSEILPVTTVISNVISHLIALCLLIAAVVFLTGALSPMLAVIFIYMFLTAIFALGLGWILSSLNVFIRDVGQVLGLVMMVWMFFTPLFYPPSIFPAKYLFIFKLNPAYHFVEGYRLALLAGRFEPAGDFIYFAVVSFITFGVGGVFFRRLKPGFAEAI